MISLQNLEIVSQSQPSPSENKNLQVARSLMSENDFLGMDINRNLRSFMKEKIEKYDLRNIAKEPKNIYPFYPDLEVSHPTHNASIYQIYLRNSFSQKLRCPFWKKENKVFPLADLPSCT